MKLTSIISKIKQLNPVYLWGGINVFLILLIVSLLIKTFIAGKQERVENALLSGQRLEISLADGTVHGRLREKKEDTKVADNKADNKKDTDVSSTDTKDGEEVKTRRTTLKLATDSLGDKPVVVLIVTGVGLSSSTTEDAIDMPKEITLSFSPYAPSVKEWANLAKSKGHDILLTVPMETKDYKTDDPGPYALLAKSSKDDNNTRFKMLLGLMDDYVAIQSDKDEIFTHSIESVKPIITTLKEKGIYFVYGGGYSNLPFIQVAKEMDYPIIVSDYVIDEEISSDYINGKLSEIENTAKEKGYVVAIARPYPITIRMIEMWMAKLPEKGIVALPVSKLFAQDE